MRAVVQRVKSARVVVGGKVVGRTEGGLLVYLGVGADDGARDVEYLVEKIAGLRIFRDESGNMNRSVRDVEGTALVISQFTLHGDARRGKRPSFVGAMEPEGAQRLYESFAVGLAVAGVPCERGIFGAMMHVHSINDGPVTILLDSRKLF